MIKSRTLRLSLTVLALVPFPLAAQQTIGEKAEPPGQQTTDGSTPEPTSSKQEAPTPVGGTPDGRTPPARDDSPFDYRSSEKISEDLSVSFPVDI